MKYVVYRKFLEYQEPQKKSLFHTNYINVKEERLENWEWNGIPV